MLDKSSFEYLNEEKINRLRNKVDRERERERGGGGRGDETFDQSVHFFSIKLDGTKNIIGFSIENMNAEWIASI